MTQNITTALENRLLIPGINAVWGMAPDFGKQYTELYGMPLKSEKFQEYDVEMRYLGAATTKPEGSPIGSDTAGQRFVTNYVHKTIGQSYGMTREAVMDNQYQQEFPQKTISLKQSLNTTKNILASAVLNNAFNANFPMGDGQPLCSPVHIIDNGTFANAPSGNATVDFSEAGLEDAIITIQQFKMQSGILEQVMAQKLVLHRNDQFAAIRILKSNFQAETGNNAITAINHGNRDNASNGNYLPKGFTVNQYLTQASAWFMITDASNGFKHFQREDVVFDTYVDFPTDTVVVKALERYCFGVTNVRAVYGSPGA